MSQEAGVRTIQLEGPVNVRDAGGICAADGRTVIPGRLFRGDHPDALSAADARRLFDELGIQTVLDLRSAREQGDPAAWPGVTWLHTPLVTEDGQSNPMLDPAAAHLGDFYRQYLDEGPAYVVAAVRAVIAAASRPILVHCAGGKDRTGVVIALVLSLLGVSAEDVVADYVISGSNAGAIRDRLLAQHPEYASVLSGPITTVMTATADTMQSFLAGLDVEAWCLAAGLSAAEIARLRSELLVAVD